MASIAIIGTGIAGMACGYFLHDRHDLTFYEKNDYIGGHTNTVLVEEDGEQIPIDTGFIVYNEVTYPNLTKLLAKLGVETSRSSMTFSVQHLPSGLEYCGTGLPGLFAQRKNVVNPGFVRLLLEINRFNTQCLELLDNKRYQGCSLIEYLKLRKYSEDFREKYLLPMSSAIWSTDPDRMLGFPALTLVRFFQNHGLLGLNSHHQWRTVTGGSRSYREKIIAPFRERIHIKRGATRILRQDGGVTITDATGARATYDQVILACHADQARALLADPTDLEARLLGEFPYQTNRATLHTDECVMPRTKKAWSSWNYRLEINARGYATPSTVYWMNSLQPFIKKRNYFVSINDRNRIDRSQVLYEIEYEHPTYSLETIAAQKELHRLNQNRVTWFCGSYFRYGFHEDALTSAIDVCRELTGQEIWP